MQPDNIWQGIYTRLMGSTNNFKTAIGSELFFGENPRAPGDVVYPYCVAMFVGGELDRDSANKYEKPVMRFVLYDNQAAHTRIMTTAEKLDDQLDDDEASITMTGFSVLSVDRISPLGDVTKNEIDNWRLPVDYRFHLQRTT